MLAVMAVAMSFTAKAASVTFEVADPNGVSIEVQYTPITLDASGSTVVEIEDYTSINIYAKEGYFLTSVQRKDSYSESVYNLSSCSLFANYASDYDGVTFVITTVKADEARDAEAIIVVDDASNVSCQRSGTYSYVTLESGVENKVKFMSELEKEFTFNHTAWGKTIYKITVNDEVVSPSGTNYFVTLKNGDKVVVTSNYPDVDVPVNITYGEGADGFITRVTVDGTEVDNYNDENFTVKLGSQVAIYGNTQDYKFDSMVVNGESYTSSYFNSYEFTVTETNYNIVVNAHKYGTIKAYVTVDNVDNVVVYRGYSSNGDVIALESGVKTEVELSENNPLISWKESSGCFIESVTVDGEDRTGYSSLSNIAEGTEIVITTGIISREKTALVWVDDISLANYGGSFYGSYDRYLHSFSMLKTGYNEIKFGDIDNQFYFSAYGSTFESPVVYQNDVIVEAKYGYNITFADGDVVKIFLSTSAPETYNVTFAINGDAADKAAENMNVTKDLINVVENWTNGFSALQGTQVDFTLSNTVDYELQKVLVNGLEIIPDENGKYSFVVTADTNVTFDHVTGIDEVGAEAGAVEYYNLQGVKVENPEKGVFIKKQGGKTTKVVL